MARDSAETGIFAPLFAPIVPSRILPLRAPTLVVTTRFRTMERRGRMETTAFADGPGAAGYLSAGTQAGSGAPPV